MFFVCLSETLDIAKLMINLHLIDSVLSKSYPLTVVHLHK